MTTADLTPIEPDDGNIESKESAGLFVGVRDYRRQHFVAVEFAADDAVDLAYLFVKELGHLTAERVILAISGHPQDPEGQQRLQWLLDHGALLKSPTHADLFAYLEDARNATGKHGLLVVSFSSHGFTENGNHFLICCDTHRNYLKSTALMFNDLADEIQQAEALRRLVLIDACKEQLEPSRSAVAPSWEEGFEDHIKKTNGMALLSASRAGGYSYDDEKAQNGVFTAAVIEGLRGDAYNDDRIVTPTSLAEYTDKRVKKWFASNRRGQIGLAGITAQTKDPHCANMQLKIDKEARAVQAREHKLKELRSTGSKLLNGLITGAAISTETVQAAQSVLNTGSLGKVTQLVQQLGFFKRLGADYDRTFGIWLEAVARKGERERFRVCKGFPAVMIQARELLEASTQVTFVALSPRFGGLHLVNPEVSETYRQLSDSEEEYETAVDGFWTSLTDGKVISATVVSPVPLSDGEDVPLKTGVLEPFSNRDYYNEIDVEAKLKGSIEDCEILARSAGAEAGGQLYVVKELPLQLIMGRLRDAKVGEALYGCLMLLVGTGSGVTAEAGNEIGLYFVVDEDTKKFFEKWIKSRTRTRWGILKSRGAVPASQPKPSS